MKPIIILISLCSICISFNSFAEVLTEDMVVESARRNHPKIFINEEKIRTAQAQLQEAQGEFDTKLETNYKQFTSGYYDGRGYLESKIVKPLPLANAKVYTGYTKSSGGIYPEMNQYFSTKSDGRAMFGFEFSLLRGFLINEQASLKKMAKIDVEISKNSQKLMEQQIIADARKSFWKYIYTKKILNLHKEMLEISLNRNESLEIQVKKGDKAPIILDENRRIILRRQSTLDSMQRELLNSAVSLSMYLRGENQEPVEIETIVSAKNSEIEPTHAIPKNYHRDIQHAKERRLDIKIAKSLLKQQDIQMKVSKNQRLPVVDVGFETSQDYGVGAIEKDQMLHKVKVNVSIPLENNKQDGKFQKNSAQLRASKRELQLLENSIANEILATHNRIFELDSIHKNAKEEVEIAKKLLKAENIRFKNGDSDFFMLNAREQDLLNAQEYCYKLKLALVEISIEYEFMTKNSLADV